MAGSRFGAGVEPVRLMPDSGGPVGGVSPGCALLSGYAEQLHACETSFNEAHLDLSRQRRLHLSCLVVLLAMALVADVVRTPGLLVYRVLKSFLFLTASTVASYWLFRTVIGLLIRGMLTKAREARAVPWLAAYYWICLVMAVAAAASAFATETGRNDPITAVVIGVTGSAASGHWLSRLRQPQSSRPSREGTRPPSSEEDRGSPRSTSSLVVVFSAIGVAASASVVRALLTVGTPTPETATTALVAVAAFAVAIGGHGHYRWTWLAFAVWTSMLLVLGAVTARTLYGAGAFTSIIGLVSALPVALGGLWLVRRSWVG